MLVVGSQEIGPKHPLVSLSSASGKQTPATWQSALRAETDLGEAVIFLYHWRQPANTPLVLHIYLQNCVILWLNVGIYAIHGVSGIYNH